MRLPEPPAARPLTEEEAAEIMQWGNACLAELRSVPIEARGIA